MLRDLTRYKQSMESKGFEPLRRDKASTHFPGVLLRPDSDSSP